MNQLRVGFNMHPRWAFGEALPGFLEPLQAAGLQALEFELWDGDPDWPRSLLLMEMCQRLGIELCFHAPYRGASYNIAGFAGDRRTELEAAFEPMLDIAARFAPALLVVHGAWSETRPRDALCSDTLAFLGWILARYPSLTPALENLSPNPRRVKIGDSRVEILRIVQEVSAPPEYPGLGNPSRAGSLGLCWDMGHDVLAGRLSVPEQSFLRHTVHVHLHDVDEKGTDHYPLLYGRVPYRAWLPALLQAGFDGIVTLEIKGGQLAHLDFERVRQILVASITEIAGFSHAGQV